MLVEVKSDDGWFYVGTACRYAPVEFASNSSPIGEFVEVASEAEIGGRIRGTPAAWPQ